MRHSRNNQQKDYNTAVHVNTRITCVSIYCGRVGVWSEWGLWLDASSLHSNAIIQLIHADQLESIGTSAERKNPHQQSTHTVKTQLISFLIRRSISPIEWIMRCKRETLNKRLNVSFSHWNDVKIDSNTGLQRIMNSWPTQYIVRSIERDGLANESIAFRIVEWLHISW